MTILSPLQSGSCPCMPCWVRTSSSEVGSSQVCEYPVCHPPPCLLVSSLSPSLWPLLFQMCHLHLQNSSLAYTSGWGVLRQSTQLCHSLSLQMQPCVEWGCITCPPCDSDHRLVSCAEVTKAACLPSASLTVVLLLFSLQGPQEKAERGRCSQRVQRGIQQR